MNTEKILLQVKKAIECYKHDELFCTYQILTELAADLFEDIRSNTNKKNGAGKIEKVLKDIFKNASRECNIKMMQYTTIQNGKQYALDGHRLLELNTPIDAPVWERDNEDADLQKYYDVLRIMPATTPTLEVKAPDLLELKAFNKYYNKSAKTCVLLEAANGEKIAVNSRYLENALNNFTDAKIYASCLRRGKHSGECSDAGNSASCAACE